MYLIDNIQQKLRYFDYAHYGILWIIQKKTPAEIPPRLINY